MLTVTGGKLTTFRLMSHDTLNMIRSLLPRCPKFDSRQRVLATAPVETSELYDLSPV